MVVSSTQDPQPISRLPLELLAEIAQFLSHPADLLNLSRCNKALLVECRPKLYSCIKASNLPSLIKALRVLIRRPSLAEHVTEVYLDVGGNGKRYDLLSSFDSLVAKALSVCTRLQALHIAREWSPRAMARQPTRLHWIERCGEHPHLQFLSLVHTSNKSLINFYERHPSISTFEARMGSTSMFVPAHVLPNLTRVRGTAGAIAPIVIDRPIRAISTSLLSDSTSPYEFLSHGSVPLQHLTVQDDCFSDTLLLEGITQYAPSLTSLCILHSPDEDSQADLLQCETEEWASTLSSLRSMRELVVPLPSPRPKTLAQIWRARCPSLRVVAFYKSAGGAVIWSLDDEPIAQWKALLYGQPHGIWRQF